MVINWQECLQMADNREGVAREILAAFVAELPETAQAIREASQKPRSASLLSVVHRLHGGCCYTGVPNLKASAHALETALHQAQSEPVPLVSRLLDDIDAVLLDYQKHFSTTD